MASPSQRYSGDVFCLQICMTKYIFPVVWRTLKHWTVCSIEGSEREGELAADFTSFYLPRPLRPACEAAFKSELW